VLEITGTTQSKANLKIIGLTGGIASGKSVISEMLRSFGAIIIDADKIARKLVEINSPAWCKIKDCFGDNYFLSDGEIDRKKLGEVVFGDVALRTKLNDIMYPLIREVIIKEIQNLKPNGVKVAVVDAALLIEAGWDDLVDEVWLVEIHPDEQLKRLVKRDRISRIQAEKRIKSQTKQEIKARMAHNIIDNSLDLNNTQKQVEKLWKEIT